ncbi:MAG TPA: L,D-transpeptidase family protein [Steroidobacteraceae bacterium]|nr:L,D-transpeptidase family protein [Steroidobacteraceae bacterium]
MSNLGSTVRLRVMSRIRTASLAAAAWCFASAALAQAPAEDALKRIIEEGNPAYLDWSATSSDRDRIGKLYETNGYRLLWSDGANPTAAAISLLQQLRFAGDRGLDPLDYPGNALAYLLVDLIDAPRAGIEQWALFDAGLSLAGMRFLSDVHIGRVDPASIGHHVSMERISLDVPATLAHLSTAVDVAVAVDALEPQFSHYALLKKHLSHYRALADEPGLNELPALPAKSLKPGDEYAGAAQLRHLLVALGDAAAPAPDAPIPQSLTPDLVEALKKFQSRHGEKADGVLGAATFVELTRPLSQRVRQIELTLERWRWLPSELVTAPIIVNIPQFRLFAFESTADSEARIRQMDVIVGKAFDSTQTPVFASDMSYLIFRPYWEVPYNIALKEIVPSARSNPASIERHQMEIVSGYGDSAAVMPNTAENVELVAKGTLRLRQRPGPNNSLGLVKFMLPNPFNVYLHSTPAQSLFAESRRDFSHGCIRVSDPVALAQYVLRDSPEWTRDKIQAAMNGTEPLTVTLKNRIRVFIVYGTAIATEKGNVLFFDDIYGHDERLEKALQARRARS